VSCLFSTWQCCRTVTIFYGSGSDFWKVMVPVLTFEKVMVPVPVPTFEKLRFWFRFQLHIYTIKSKFFLQNLFPFNIVSLNINKFIVKCERKMLNEGNQIHNFIFSSGSRTVINYGSSSGSDFLTSYGSKAKSYGSYGSGSTTLLPGRRHSRI
jgi:hypothetical protein